MATNGTAKTPQPSAAVRLAGLATALPPHCIGQHEVRDFAQEMFGAQSRDFTLLRPSFCSAGIERRHSVRPLDWYRQPLGWQTRNSAFTQAAEDLLAEAASRALADAGLSARDIDTVVTLSSTGIATPTLEARLIGRLGLRGDIRRVPVFGLGCAGGVSGLSLAARLARAEPGSHVLMLCVETCTLAFRADRGTRADIIASILFGDGAAAACVSSTAGPGPIVGAGVETTWPDSLAIMGWDIDDLGFGVIFDRSIPDFVRREFAAAVDTALTRLGLARGDIGRFAFHPGGAKVIAAIEDALGLGDGYLDHERAVLRDCGNMSAPTALFVLERIASQPAPGTVLLGALGPGFTASLLMLDFGAPA